MIRALFNAAVAIFTTMVVGSMVIAYGAVRPHGESGYTLVRRWARILLKRCGVKTTVEGIEEVDFSRPMVFMTNHRSHYDTPVLIDSIPVRLCIVAKKELRKIPFLGGAMKSLGMIFLDRGDREKARRSMEEAAGKLRGDLSVLMFPEGTRSDDGRTMRAFRKGGFHLAKAAGLPIQPLVITGTEKVLPKKSLRIRPGHAVLRFGRTIPVTDESTVEGLLEQTRAEMERLLSDMDGNQISS